MKNFSIRVFAVLSLLFTIGSCTDYLDKAPEAGLESNDVFEKYANFKLFFDAVYDGRETVGTSNYEVNIRCAYPLWIMFWDQKTTFDELTEIADAGRYFRAQDWKGGQMGATVNMMTTDLARRPIMKSMFTVIRICNMALANVDLIKDATEEEKDDFRGQAYFFRGYAHFNLIRFWGAMPHINRVLTEDPNDWDLPRPSRYQSYANVALDMDSAFIFFEKAKKIRRDPGPGQSGHLADNDQHRPSGIAAKAIKARALLYAASPLNNANGTKDWEDAAKANWEAIQLALQYEYDLLPMSNYADNYLAKYSNEQLFAWYYGNSLNNGSSQTQGILSGDMANKTSSWSGECPTQNMVDKFETKWGDALNTESDRNTAASAGHYNEQNPYVNRDPRFYNTIIYNQAAIVWSAYQNKAQIWFQLDANGNTVYGEHRNELKYQGCTRTGYYAKKHLGNISGGNTSYKPYMTDPIIRLGELYLNYAEAVNEAYGPSAMAPEASLTAIDAINKIRNRATLPNIDSKYTADKDVFREKLKNERTVELCFEGFHHYFDLRRWKDAPAVMSQPLSGVHAEKVTVSTTYPTGFKYTRYELPAERQPRWKDAMYFIPFDTDDYYKMKNFDTSLNPAW